MKYINKNVNIKKITKFSCFYFNVVYYYYYSLIYNFML